MDTDVPGKPRWIEHPKPSLLQLHVRIADLLRRVGPPDYLFSTPGRSALDNARQHTVPFPTVTLDVKSFFSNARGARIHRVFSTWLECSPDVSTILARLCECGGHIPTGSPLSPELSFWAYRDMFDEINEYVSQRRGIFTLYVDDMTASFPGASRVHLNRIGRIVERNGLEWHKGNFYPVSAPKSITGAIVCGRELRVPNRLHRKMRDQYRELDLASDFATQSDVANRLRGRLDYSAQIDSRLKPRQTGAHALAKGLTRKKSALSRKP